jgi:hypothetical protein
MHACKGGVARNPTSGCAKALDEYIEEEQGHDQWILDDIRAAGGGRRGRARRPPGHATEVMVAVCLRHHRGRNPLGFFGMVHVLEGTSVSLALLAAGQIQNALQLPDAAFKYLRSHGTLDQQHTAHFELLMDRIDDAGDQAPSSTRRAPSTGCTATCSAVCRCRKAEAPRREAVA